MQGKTPTGHWHSSLKTLAKVGVGLDRALWWFCVAIGYGARAIGMLLFMLASISAFGLFFLGLLSMEADPDTGYLYMVGSVVLFCFVVPIANGLQERKHSPCQ